MFNPNHTFKSFILDRNGGKNTFAYDTALAVAESPGTVFNPLFLYGDVGLGKTHLLHAIGQHMIRRHKNIRVACITTEKMTMEFIEAIQANRLKAFRKKYQQIDALLIDDLQCLAGKEQIQAEFFHNIKFLVDAGKSVVLACGCPPARRLPPKIRALEQKLVSGFEFGQVASLEPSDSETRLAILNHKAKSMNVQLPADILHFLADRIRTDIRRLEGAMLQVSSYAAITAKPLTISRVETLLFKTLRDEARLV